MTKRYKIGIKNGRPVYAIYTRDGGLPELRIRHEKKTLASYRGSSIGPINPQCDPTASDIAYWRSLAGLAS